MSTSRKRPGHYKAVANKLTDLPSEDQCDSSAADHHANVSAAAAADQQWIIASRQAANVSVAVTRLISDIDNSGIIRDDYHLLTISSNLEKHHTHLDTEIVSLLHRHDCYFE